jgi:hypothetical protein
MRRTRIIAAARQPAPIAIGPHGLEVLSDELPRAVLRDTRLTTARGLGVDLQGITSARYGIVQSPTSSALRPGSTTG